MNEPIWVMTVTPANCPAEVRFVSDMSTASNQVHPASTAMIPNAIETEKYPSAMGIPSLIPLLKSIAKTSFLLCVTFILYTHTKIK